MKLLSLIPSLSKRSCLAATFAAVFTTTGAEKIIWTEGHGDVGANYVNGGWEWTFAEDLPINDVIARSGDNARNAIPDLPAFSFLGAPGNPIWILPAGQSPGIPYLGISAEGTASGLFVNDRFDLLLNSVRGPGDFFMWTTTGVGGPTVLMNSRDGIAAGDKADVPAGGHFHMNWGFTAPGTYRIGFKASGLLTGQTVPTVSDEAVATFEVSVLKSGEADIEVAFEEGELEFHIHDEGADVEFDPAHVALQAGPASWQTVPANPAFSFLGNTGANIYVLPQQETDGVLFLGMAAGEVESGTFANDTVAVNLVSVEGSGQVAYYEIDQFGAPTVLFNSANGITPADSVNVTAGAHAHRNWSFSQPGIYRITLQATGTLVGGGTATSEPTTFLFEVLPPTFLDEGEIDFEVAFEDGAWELVLLDEAAEREFDAEGAVLVANPESQQTVPNDPAFSFLGAAGAPVYVLPQDETEGLLFIGIAGDEISSGVFQGERVNLELVSAAGPGHFALYSVDSFGSPTVYMNSRDGITTADLFPIPVGSHGHVNWAFTEPGEYRLNFRATGTLLSPSDSSASDPVTLRFLIEQAVQQNGPTLTASLLNNPRRLQIAWQGRTGVAYQLQSRAHAATGVWGNVGPVIAGQAGEQLTTVDISTDTLELFRVVETPF